MAFRLFLMLFWVAPAVADQATPSPSAAAGASADADTSRPQTVLVRLKSTAMETSRVFDSALRKLHLQVSNHSPSGILTLTAINDVSLVSNDEMARTLNSNPAVQAAEVDRQVAPASMPNDPEARFQWHHSVINTIDAWATTTGLSSVTIASCDTGVDRRHPDLKPNLLPGYNSEDESKDATMVNAHGTQTAGLIIARANNGIGTAGVSGTAKLLPIRVTNAADGAAYLSAILRCIEFAAENDVKVVHIPYPVGDSALVGAAANYLKRKGGITVIAAGNGGLRIRKRHQNSILLVGAITRDGSRAVFSNSGPSVELVAPGDEILTTNAHKGTTTVDGTSYASAIAAGVAGLVYSIYPDFTPAQVRSVLLKSSTHSRVDAKKAVDLAVKLKPKKSSKKKSRIPASKVKSKRKSRQKTHI